MKFKLFLLGCLVTMISYAQDDPEFPKGSVFYFGVKQGKNTGFNSSPDLWTGSLFFSPQFTIIPRHLRLGLQTELAYTDKHTAFLAGPKLAWKLKTIGIRNLGSLLNIQLQGEYLFGNNYCLAGGSLAVEAFQLLTADIGAHYESEAERWWFRAGVGIRLFYKKKNNEPENPLIRRNQ